MVNIDFKDLINARAHIGHLSRKWHPKMAPYIFCKHKNIHIINVKKTIQKLDEACNAIEKIVASGKKIFFISTKKQIKTLINDKISKTNMPYVTERWLGGMLTNFVTIKKAIKKMESIDRMKKEVNFNKLSKKEKLFIDRDKIKLQKVLGSISNMKRLPGAVFIIDIKKEKTALKEAIKLNIPIFAIVDTNSNPQMVDYPIPANDDTSKSVSIIIDQIVDAINKGLKTNVKVAEGENNQETAVDNKKHAKASEEKVAEPKEDAAKKTASPVKKVTESKATTATEKSDKKSADKKASKSKANTAKKTTKSKAKKATAAKKPAKAKAKKANTGSKKK